MFLKPRATQTAVPLWAGIRPCRQEPLTTLHLQVRVPMTLDVKNADLKTPCMVKV